MTSPLFSCLVYPSLLHLVLPHSSLSTAGPHCCSHCLFQTDSCPGAARMQALWAHRHLLSLCPCLWLWAPPLGWDVLSRSSRKRSGCGFRFWVCHSHPGQFWTLGFCEAHFLNPKMGMKMQTQWCRVGSQGGLYVKEPGVPGQGGRAGPPPPQQTAASCWQVALHCTAPWMFPLFRRRWFSFSPKSCPELAGCECWGWCGESCSPF